MRQPENPVSWMSRQLLGGAGFTGIEIDPIQAPMWLGADPDGAHAFALGLLGWMLEGLCAPERQHAFQQC
jgi:hypothetical protein